MPKKPLDEYWKKRDPTRTNEPFGEVATRPSEGTRSGDFVVHLHDATRTHYDVRIEIGGTLRSFAVPKGPSLDPKEKRLAVETEDHPVEYLDFEAVIPEGNYGAGPMIVWDRGRVLYPVNTAEEGIALGKIDFDLVGHKLRGRFGLIRTSDRNKDREIGKKEQPLWLLVKKEDAFARPDVEITETEPASVLSGLKIDELAQAPEIAQAVFELARSLGAKPGRVDGRRLSPMLCNQTGEGLAREASPGRRSLDADGMFYELKLDGVRIVADRREGDVTLAYRSGRPASSYYPEIVRAMRALPSPRIVLDGEIVAFDESGKPSFQRLGRRIHVQRPSDVAMAARSVPVVFLVFDVLAVGDGETELDLRPLPLTKRKEILAACVRGHGLVRALDHLEGNGQLLYDFCLAQKLEGVVAKKASSPYREGPSRTNDWIKIKCEREADFVVIGFTVGENSRSRLGALDIASYDEHGTLIATGKVGSGLEDKTIAILLSQLVVRDTCAAVGALGDAPRGRTFVEPNIVVNVRYLGFTDDGSIRFPVFCGIRDDVDPKQCRTLPTMADDPMLAATSAAPSETDSQGRRRKAVLTNQKKIFFPEDEITKGDICAYYEAIADTLVPFLKDRPVTLVRYPDGIHGKNFFQWRVPKGTPSWVRSFPLRFEEESDKGKADKHVFLIDDADTLLYIANLGCIPLHVMATRATSLDCCDFGTIDFDLGGRELRDAITLARTLREILDAIGLEGYPKTSGQTGLHVLVPLGPGVPFEAARGLVELFARMLEGKHFDISTTQRTKERRGGKVYIDTVQTGRTRTIVSPYSVRAVRGATVSTPLTWEEVSYALDPRKFTVFTVPGRVAERGDPLAGILDERPDVAGAIEKLGALLGGSK